MKKSIIQSALILACSFSFYCSDAQWKDSASYKQAVIQLYKQQTTGLKTYKYLPNAYTQVEQDTMFTNAMAWKKENVDHPIILNYYKLQKGTPEADSKIKYLEDTASKSEYAEVMTKAAQLYAKQTTEKNNKQHIAPGISTSPKANGKIENKDKEIKDKVLGTWKF